MLQSTENYSLENDRMVDLTQVASDKLMTTMMMVMMAMAINLKNDYRMTHPARHGLSW